MASLTRQGRVFSFQGIPGPVMVESGNFPGGGIVIMALGTFFLERGAMGIGMTITAACETKPGPFLFFVALSAVFVNVRPF